MKILLVEEPSVMRLFEGRLKQEGHEIKAVCNIGHDADDAFEREKFDFTVVGVPIYQKLLLIDKSELMWMFGEEWMHGQGFFWAIKYALDKENFGKIIFIRYRDLVHVPLPKGCEKIILAPDINWLIDYLRHSG